MAEPAPSLVDAPAGPSLLRRRWWAVVLGVLLGLAAGQAFTAWSTPRYTSTTSVLVLPTRATTASASGGAPSEVNMNTEAELVRSEQVARGAIGQLGTPESVESVLERLTVTVPVNSQVLAISYADRTAELAQRGTRAVAQSYLTSREADVQADRERLTGAVRKDLEFAEEQLRLATDKAASLPSNSPDRVYAEAQRDILGNQITNLNSRLSTLTAGTDRAGVIITDAVLPSRASFPVPALDLGAGLVLGLLLGAALALLVDRLDHRLRRGADVSRRLRLPVLADLARPAVAAQPGAYDRLRNALDRGRGPAPVQVVDAGGKGACSGVALELAQAWGRVGRTTLVVARAASLLPDALDLSGRAGLSDLLQGSADLDDVQHDSPAHPGLRVVPPGRAPEALEALLQSPAATAALGALARPGTVVVLETADPGTSAAAQSLATTSATVVLAVLAGDDERTVARAAQAVEEVGGALAGVVLVPRRRRRQRGAAGPAGTSPAPHAPAPSSVRDAVEPASTAADGWPDEAQGDRGAEPTSLTGGSVAAQRPPR